ncbi:AcrB/AcrD/AcrF family protein [Hasllibacter halocynthiae]|uniref:AcrB/AcrD/AcrF family protein n=1 Tax=Hasllibacter halocynthiae TaxID=595589 RepID=A0A2T0X3T9_9RHOB|nr:efflux RND transporter permease subunit [Hasllibacter halocynthiae]PRY93609.1 AcrB/AcrD/AcrF family protein [Hasllibacter halocynthiae]
MRRLPGAGLLGYFARHRTAANLLLLVLLAAGVAVLPRMRAQFFPDVVLETATVSVAWEGAGAEEVDAGILQALEPALLRVEGVEGTRARATEGLASVFLEFEPGTDMARAMSDLERAAEAAGPLPEEAEEPETVRGVWRDRVTDLVISGPVAPDTLARIGDELVLRLFAEGVTRADIRGVAAPEILLETTGAELIRHRTTLREIAEVARAGAASAPAGAVGGSARLRAGEQARDAAAIAALPLRLEADGTVLRVGDVARVETLGADRARAYFVGDEPAVTIRIERDAAGDALGIQATVEEVIAEVGPTLPEGVRIEPIRTLADSISGRIGILTENGLFGLVLVVGLLFLFLNARTAFWVAAGIPVAMLTAVALMWAGGLTINMISLFALIITLGIVVDDAIVVGEHSDYRARTLGEGATEAAENAAVRMFPPVFAATLTTVIAFAALVVVGGRFGTLIADIPFTVIAVLVASLVECFLILPRHMAHALKERPRRGFSPLRAGVGALALLLLFAGIGAGLWIGGVLLAGRLGLLADGWGLALASAPLGAVWGLVLALGLYGLRPASERAATWGRLSDHGIDSVPQAVNAAFDRVRAGLFVPLMRAVVAARYVVLAAMVALLASQAASFMRGDVTWRFFNAPEQGSVSGNFAMLPGATREDALEMMAELQRATEAVAGRYEAEHDRNPVLHALAEVGGNSGQGLGGDRDAELLGSIAIELINADLRPYSSFEFTAALQDEVRDHPLLETVSFRRWGSGPGGDSLSVDLVGAEPDVLKAAAEEVKAALGAFPAVSGLGDSLTFDKEELVLAVTPQGRALGFDEAAVGATLRDRLSGIEAASWPVGPRSATVRVELAPGDRAGDFLERTLLRTPAGEYVPLSDVVTVRSEAGFGTITRQDGVRIAQVTGELSEDDPEAAAAVMQALRDAILPDVEERFGVGTRLSGLAEQEREFLLDALIGFLLCVLGIYLVLAWIFASFTRPLVIMAIIPFGLVGTIWGHAAWDVPLSMFTVVGLIGMTGIIINDSIVLVTTIDGKAESRGLLPSIVEGTAERLRPVFLTTATTVLGLAPLLFERSQDAQFLKPTVITLVYGLGFGMAIVLLLVPALMAVQRDFGRMGAAMRRALAGRRAGPAFALAWALGALGLLWGGATLGTAAVGEPLIDGGAAGAAAAFLAGVGALLALFLLAGAAAIRARRRVGRPPRVDGGVRPGA